MSNLNNIPAQDGFETQLDEQLLNTSTTGDKIKLQVLPDATIDSDNPTTIVVGIGENTEVISINGVDTGTNEVTILERALPMYVGHSPSPITHSKNSSVIISDNHSFWADIKTAINSKFDSAGGTISGNVTLSGTLDVNDCDINGDLTFDDVTAAGINAQSVTTTERDAISTPNNGAFVYNETTDTFDGRIGGSWDSLTDKTTFDAHATSTSNPHSVTKTQVGLSEVANIKNNFSATVAPTVSNDSSEGYAIGSQWIDTVTDKTYICSDVSVGAAVWTQSNNIASGSLDKASQAEAEAGTDDAKYMTSLKVKQSIDVNAKPSPSTSVTLEDPYSLIGGTTICQSITNAPSNYTVPTGKVLVICSIVTGADTDLVYIDSKPIVYRSYSVYTSGISNHLTNPIFAEAGAVLSTNSVNAVIFGTLVDEDANLTPVVESLDSTGTATYTVPTGKTFVLSNAYINSSSTSLQNNSNAFWIGYCNTAFEVGTDNEIFPRIGTALVFQDSDVVTVVNGTSTIMGYLIS